MRTADITALWRSTPANMSPSPSGIAPRQIAIDRAQPGGLRFVEAQAT
jgi:hypothetical protein